MERARQVLKIGKGLVKDTLRSLLLVLVLAPLGASADTEPEEVESALEQLKTACKAPKIRLVIDRQALKAGETEDENFLFNEGVATTQVVQLLLALADGCAKGMTVTDKLVREAHGRLGTKISRPTRPVPLARLSALQKIEIGLNKNSAAFLAWSAANWGTPPRTVYEQLLKGRYDQQVLEDDLGVLGRYAKLPPQIRFDGATGFFGIGPAFELVDPWFPRVLDIALQKARPD